MKKEILFRGFHPDENGPQEITLNGKKIRGLWVQGWYCGATCDSFFAKARKSAQILDSELIWYEVIPETVGEYIGIDDCDGEKIFDDDIVDIAADDERGVIEWDDDEAKFIVLVDDIASDFSCFWGHDLSVIGNIFSTPELIEGGEQE